MLFGRFLGAQESPNGAFLLTNRLFLGFGTLLSALKVKQAGEVVTHLAFYAGWPNAFSALPVMKDVFEKRGH